MMDPGPCRSGGSTRARSTPPFLPRSPHSSSSSHTNSPHTGLDPELPRSDGSRGKRFGWPVTRPHVQARPAGRRIFGELQSASLSLFPPSIHPSPFPFLVSLDSTPKDCVRISQWNHLFIFVFPFLGEGRDWANAAQRRPECGQYKGRLQPIA